MSENGSQDVEMKMETEDQPVSDESKEEIMETDEQPSTENIKAEADADVPEDDDFDIEPPKKKKLQGMFECFVREI